MFSNKIVNKDVATLQEAVTIETGRTQNEDYEEVNQYTNLTRSNQVSCIIKSVLCQRTNEICNH